ncbi:alpha/beta fold hydrolase [Aeromicrobium sp.]|uniref:alpha/beta fold hydrolase n=1 Tax=Aeromicrobium sp. TaxID=1871063 RepID=UPI003D6B2EE0
MPTIDLPQGQIRYHVAGPDESDAPPVVLIHGFLVDHGLWTGVTDLLAAQGIRSYSPDLPLGSHTIALKPDADQSPRGVAQLIIDFLTALDLHDVTLVGSDTGGALCQFVLDADHTRIGRLVLTNCDAFDQFPPAPFDFLLKLGRKPWRLRLMGESMRPRFLRHSVIGFGGLVDKPLDPQLSRRWITPLLEDAGVRRDTSRFVSNIKPSELVDVSTRLGTFGKPVRLVWGAADRFFKIEFAHRLKDAFGPNAEVVEVPGGRTFLSLDEPELVADEIRAVSYARG